MHQVSGVLRRSRVGRSVGKVGRVDRIGRISTGDRLRRECRQVGHGACPEVGSSGHAAGWLPDDVDVVLGDQVVVGHNGEALVVRLGDEEPIERIVVLHRQ